MALLLYEEINSSFLGKVTDYDFVDLTDDEFASTMLEKLHTVLSKPYCRRLFSTLLFDDENQQIEYTLKLTTTEDEDSDFVTEMLSLGMVIEWIEPQLNSKRIMQQLITSNKESKFYSQAQHLSSMQSTYDACVKKQRDLIRDRGFIYNSYLGGANG